MVNRARGSRGDQLSGRATILGDFGVGMGTGLSGPGRPAWKGRKARADAAEITSPADRAILTEDVQTSITASKPTVVSLDGVELGGAARTIGYQPQAQDFDVTVSTEDGEEITVSVVEANRIATDLSTWSRTNVGAPTAGQADPFGGTGAYKFTMTATGAANHLISKAMSPVSTVNNSGFEIWAEYNSSLPVLVVYPTNDDVSEYCGIHLDTGDKVGNFADACIVEEIGNWKRVQFRRGKGTFTTSTVSLYFLQTLANPIVLAQAMAGTEYMTLYAPRSADGVLPFSDYDQMQVLSKGTFTVPTTANNPYTYDCQRWESRSPFQDKRLDMNQNRGFLDVVVPTTYDANRATPYPVLYILEVEYPPGTAYSDGLGYIRSIGVHNTYDCIIARTTFNGTVGVTPWYADRGDGTTQHQKHMQNFARFMEDHFNVSTERKDRLALGFSKSGWGALSMMLHTQLYGFVGCWDVPWDMTYGGVDYGQVAYFGSEAQFLLYNPRSILKTYGQGINDKPRIVLGGSAAFDADTVSFEAFLIDNSIPHTYIRNVLAGGGGDHEWDTGWAANMIAAMFAQRAYTP